MGSQPQPPPVPDPWPPIRPTNPSPPINVPPPPGPKGAAWAYISGPGKPAREAGWLLTMPATKLVWECEMRTRACWQCRTWRRWLRRGSHFNCAPSPAAFGALVGQSLLSSSLDGINPIGRP